MKRLEGKGWAVTIPTPKLQAWIEGLKLDQAAFTLAYRALESKPKSKGKQKKWTCECAKHTIRAAADIDVTCNRCGKVLVKEAEDDEDGDGEGGDGE